jgi:L-alanine-DL-glutamate epimerase-like enolase superfamily enzyme
LAHAGPSCHGPGRRKANIRFAAGENEYSLESFDRLMTSGAVEYVQPEISKIGGLSMARKVSSLADLHNMVICPHAFRIGPALYASIHWALTQMNMAWLEIPWLPEGDAFPSAVPMPKITMETWVCRLHPDWALPYDLE